MTPLEEAAVAYITARRAKLAAIKARNAATRRGHPWPDPEDPENPPCWLAKHDEGGRDRYGNLPEEEWCEHCRESKIHHDARHRHAIEQGAALRRLERLVRKETA